MGQKSTDLAEEVMLCFELACNKNAPEKSVA